MSAVDRPIGRRGSFIAAAYRDAGLSRRQASRQAHELEQEMAELIRRGGIPGGMVMDAKGNPDFSFYPTSAQEPIVEAAQENVELINLMLGGRLLPRDK